MSKQILLATNNAHKVREYQEILGPFGYVVVTPKDLQIVSDPEENGTNYQENAYIKAKSFAKKVHCPVISDDSGLEVNALGKFPGIYSSRFEEECGSYPKAWAELISRLEGKEDRSAQFMCTICFLESPEAQPLFFVGKCPGFILKEPHGSNGFGYDPIFHASEPDLDFGTASEEEKNAHSHRAKASIALKEYFAKKEGESL